MAKEHLEHTLDAAQFMDVLTEHAKPQAQKDSQGAYQFTLTSYDPIDVFIPPIFIGEPEVDHEIKQLLDAQTTYTTLAKTIVEPHDTAKISITTLLDDEIFEPLTHQSTFLQLNAGVMPEEFEQQLIGTPLQQPKTIEFHLPGFQDECMLRSEVEVLALVSVSRPQLNDKWVNENIPNCSTIEEMRAMIRDYLRVLEEDDRTNCIAQEAAQKLSGRLACAIPQELYTLNLEQLSQQTDAMIKRQGLSKEEYFTQNNIDEDSFMMQLSIEAVRNVENFCIADALIQHFKTPQPTHEELPHLLGVAATEGAACIKRLQNEGMLDQALVQAHRIKALYEFAQYSMEQQKELNHE